MTDIRARIADALREADSCLCHICRSQQAEKLSDVLLSLPGIAIVELPQPCPTPNGWRDGCLGAWQGPAGEDPVSAWTTSRYDHDAIAMPGGDFITIADARVLAAALLAAAVQAQEPK